MKVKVLLILVIVYLAGAFSWWTYSLISLSRTDYEAQVRNLTLSASLAETQFLRNAKEFQSQSGVWMSIEEATLQIDSSKLREFAQERFGNEYELVYVFFDDKIIPQLLPGMERLLENEKEYSKRKRAYYSEGIFFMLLLVLGIIWVMKSIGKIVDLNKLQRNFMMSVTHELKTPVAAVKLIMQTLNKRNLEDEKRAELINKADQNADRLTKLIDGLLVAVKIERKTLETAFQWVNANRLLLDLKHEFEILPDFKGEIRLNIADDFKIWGDQMSLKIAFSNLIDNAVKYSGGSVSLDIIGDAARKTISFADQGPGIPTGEKRKIFRQFYRIGDENVRTAKGTGMGLYLVKNILKIHKASIKVTPNQPKGTVFTIKF